MATGADKDQASGRAGPPPEGGDPFPWRRRGAQVAGLGAFALILLLPAPAGMSPEAWRVVAVGTLMAIWWITEAVPVAITSLVPLTAFPLLGIENVNAAAEPYANPAIFLIMGGFMLALGMERWHLHRRTALTIVAWTGTRQDLVVGGFMLATAAISMWVSNIATTMMMLPIALSVIRLLVPSQLERAAGAGTLPSGLPLALLLGVAYAASIGGVATLIGTPPNALLRGYLNETYGYTLGFAQWLLIGLPVASVMLLGAWLLLTRLTVRVARTPLAGAAELIAHELRQMGAMAPAERRVGLVLLATAALWLGRPELQWLIPGLGDVAIAIVAAIALFLIPSGAPGAGALLTWDWALRLPWGVLLLVGGGLSLAAAISTTGLDAWIGDRLAALGAGLPVLAIGVLITTVMIFLTELTSNTATAAAFLPVVAALAIGLGQNPLLLVAPAAIAASCAFMMPVATGPNAVVFGTGHVTIPQMARNGFALNLLGIVVINLLGYAALLTFFGLELDRLPEWARESVTG
jgi:sodium-dependent dicarboxylate transporter 2/3/5